MDKDSDAMTYDALLNGFQTVCDLDPRASHRFIYQQAADFCGLSVVPCIPERVQLGDSSFKPVLGTTTARLSIQGTTWLIIIYIIDKQQELDGKPLLFLGRQWLRQDNPVIDWTAGTMDSTSCPRQTFRWHT